MMITIQMIQVHVDHGDDQNDNYDQVPRQRRDVFDDVDNHEEENDHDDNNKDDTASC